MKLFNPILDAIYETGYKTETYLKSGFGTT